MEATAKKSSHGANVRRWREWRNIKQDTLADEIGVSQTTMSSYEKRDRLEPEILEKLAKALDIPVEAITELEQGTNINIISSTFNDTSAVNHYTFNPIEKIVELYERLVDTEKQKVAMLEELLKNQK